jgi:hypothetical protein
VNHPEALRAWLSPTARAEDVALIRAEAGAAPLLGVQLPEGRLPWGGHMGLASAPEILARIAASRVTIVFVNTRAQAELIFAALWKINEDSLPIAVHHGSLTVEQRRKVEAAMAAGRLRGVVANLARSPKGGDTDQIRGVASGECAIAVTNTYYLARIMRSEAAADKAIMDRVGVVFPNQNSWGTHVNIAGGAVARNAKNPANAVKFLEYLASPQAQDHFANGNNEWPAAKGVRIANPALQSLTAGGFKSEAIPVSIVGMNQVKVQQLLDKVGFK